MIDFKEFFSKMKLNEGGNVKVGKISSVPIPSHHRPLVKKEIPQVLDAIKQNAPHAFGKMKSNDPNLYSGSSRHFMGNAVSDKEWHKIKPTMGDVDVHTTLSPDEMSKHLTPGRQLGPYTVVAGRKVGSGYSAIMRTPRGHHHQIDFEKSDWEAGKPSKFSQFSMKSSLEDMRHGIKGVHMQFARNAVLAMRHDAHGKRTHAWSTDKGVKIKKYKGGVESTPEYDKSVSGFAKAAFGTTDKETQRNSGSFMGILRAIKKHIPKEQHEKIKNNILDTMKKTGKNNPNVEKILNKHLKEEGILDFMLYLNEAIASSRAGGLIHVDDLPLHGKEGTIKAVKTLLGLHKRLKKQGKQDISTKWDGRVGFNFGYHPDHPDKFGVGYGNKWDTDPSKIKESYPKNENLVKILTHAHKHLQSVTPAGRMFKGDYMYGPGDVTSSTHHLSFKPNTIRYNVPRNSQIGTKISNAKIGVVVHTEHMSDKQTKPLTSFSGFREHPDVHLIDPTYKGKGEYNSARSKRVTDSLKRVLDHHKDVDYNVINKHQKKLQTYIDSTVRTGKHPNYNGYINSLGAKSPKMTTIDQDKPHIEKLLKIHGNLRVAKDAIIHALDKSSDGMSMKIGRNRTGHEGYVTKQGGLTTKLVKRKSDIRGVSFSQSHSAMAHKTRIVKKDKK